MTNKISIIVLNIFSVISCAAIAAIDPVTCKSTSDKFENSQEYRMAQLEERKCLASMTRNGRNTEFTRGEDRNTNDAPRAERRVRATPQDTFNANTAHQERKIEKINPEDYKKFSEDGAKAIYFGNIKQVDYYRSVNWLINYKTSTGNFKSENQLELIDCSTKESIIDKDIYYSELWNEGDRSYNGPGGDYGPAVSTVPSKFDSTKNSLFTEICAKNDLAADEKAFSKARWYWIREKMKDMDEAKKQREIEFKKPTVGYYLTCEEVPIEKRPHNYKYIVMNCSDPAAVFSNIKKGWALIYDSPYAKTYEKSCLDAYLSLKNGYENYIKIGNSSSASIYMGKALPTTLFICNRGLVNVK
jgi:Pyruvate/2-oxoacid:ferredoxin oxidoreductase gamma subunit